MQDDGLGNRRGSQFQQGSLHIFRTVSSGAMLLQPFHVEIIAPRAFGRTELEKRMVEQRLQEFWHGRASRCPGAILVIGESAVSLNPAIHEQIARPAIETDYFSRSQIRYVADAANIQDDAMNGVMPKHSVMEGRNQRRTLPAGGDIATAEIGDDRNAGEFCQQRRIADLHRIPLFGAMAYGLPMAPDGGNTAVVEAGFGKKLFDAFGIDTSQSIGGQMAAFDFMVSAGIQGEQFFLQCRGERQECLLADSTAIEAEMRNDAVYTIQAGARHQADKGMRHALWNSQFMMF